jgi:hypothetical protein
VREPIEKPAAKVISQRLEHVFYFHTPLYVTLWSRVKR